MRFDQIIERLEAAKRHVDEASLTDTFGDMRVQLQLALQACDQAIEGIKAQIAGSLAAPPLGSTLPEEPLR